MRRKQGRQGFVNEVIMITFTSDKLSL